MTKESHLYVFELSIKTILFSLKRDNYLNNKDMYKTYL